MEKKAANIVLSEPIRQAFKFPYILYFFLIVLTLGIFLFSVSVGPANIFMIDIIKEIFLRTTGLGYNSELSEVHSQIIMNWRLPRTLLGFFVGASLAVAGASYQGVFKNPLADPFLLGAAAGAGLGATIAIIFFNSNYYGPFGAIPVASFFGALLAVSLAASIAQVTRGSTATLLLSGVATAAFFTACQTYLMQQNLTSFREIYSWLVGSLANSSWEEVLIIAPYFLFCYFIINLFKNDLDLLRFSDDEAKTLGGSPRRTRVAVIILASLLTAIAVSLSGLIGFVGLIIPHIVRLLFGYSYRIILPFSALLGGIFLCLADLLSRTVISPAELPIGVITAFIGAPFFWWLLYLLKQKFD